MGKRFIWSKPGRYSWVAKKSGCYMRIEKKAVCFKIMSILLSLVIAAGIMFEGGVSFVLAAAGSVYPEHEAYGAGIGAMPGRAALFLANNSTRGKETSYTKGEKIAIKANINGAGVFDDDSSGETNMSYTNPVLLKCLLVSLVNKAGVSPEDITVYDVSRIFPRYMVKLCTGGELKGIQFAGRRDGAADTNAPINWSYSFGEDYTSSIFLSQDPVAIDSVGADFLMNEPTVTENNSSLRGNPDVENYLREAGLVKDAPSGNVYYDGNGGLLSNLGVHEHWNNVQEKQYGRNLGREEGIELVPLTSEQSTEKPGEKQKVLVAYFSCTNTTGALAKYAAEALGADLYEMIPKIPYTEEDLAYYTGGRADQEQNDPDARPEISGSVENMEEYDAIVLGYPIWHGQAPRIISTFLESYDLSGKTIVPFCTSHSSGIGSSAANLHTLCPDSVKWADGRRFAAGTSKDEIGNWLADEGIQTPDLEACSHSYDSQVTKQPTCTAAGEIIYTCIHCARSYTEKTAAMGHKPVIVPAVPADCEKQGKTEGSHCEVCGQEITAQRVIPAAGHEFKNAIVKAGKSKDGFITEKCTVCGEEGDRKTVAAVKTIRLSRTSYTYNGKKRKPSVIVTDRNEKKLQEGTDYTVSYPASLKNAGIYTIKVQFRGNYSGIEKTSFQITPEGTVIVGVSARKKGFTVKWKKQKKQTDGYEIAFSASSKFPKKKTEIINIKGNVKVSKTVSKLKAKKKYSIRIRTYKAEGGKNKIYSGWSKPKTVKTKK